MSTKKSSWSRRSFLKVAVPIGGGAVLTAVGVSQLPRGVLRNAYRRVEPALPDSPTGRLSEPVLGGLEAVSRALLGESVDLQFYRRHFQWNAENREGFGQLYRSFVENLDDEAESFGAESFASLPEPQQVGYLDEVIRIDQQTWRKMVGTLFQRKWLMYNRHIIETLFYLYVRRDSWKRLGYDASPGIARGLDAYRLPLE